MYPKLLISQAVMLLLTVFLAGLTYTQEITIYSIPSPKGINWDSPRKLVFSYINNTFARSRYGKEKHPIGHMIVEMKDSSRYTLVGTTSQAHSGMTKKVIRKGYGLGILFEIINGRLDEEYVNLPQLKQRCETGDITFIKYRINQTVFNRLWQYLQEYKLKGYDRLYNGFNKPREGLGAGCSAFAHSFLEVGGLEEVLPSNEWAVKVQVPEKLIGGNSEKDKHVQFFKLLLSKQWAHPEKQPCRQLILYEPTILHNWILKKYNSISEGDAILKSKLGKANGLIIDCTDKMPPEEPIWINNNKTEQNRMETDVRKKIL